MAKSRRSLGRHPDKVRSGDEENASLDRCLGTSMERRSTPLYQVVEDAFYAALARTNPHVPASFVRSRCIRNGKRPRVQEFGLTVVIKVASGAPKLVV